MRKGLPHGGDSTSIRNRHREVKEKHTREAPEARFFHRRALTVAAVANYREEK